MKQLILITLLLISSTVVANDRPNEVVSSDVSMIEVQVKHLLNVIVADKCSLSKVKASCHKKQIDLLKQNFKTRIDKSIHSLDSIELDRTNRSEIGDGGWNFEGDALVASEELFNLVLNEILYADVFVEIEDIINSMIK